MKKPDNRTEKRRLGDLGEDLACEFLRRRGYRIVERNYLRKWGEIDIVAEKSTEKGSRLHFVEVKTVSHETTKATPWCGSQETSSYRPEENMHPWKLKRLGRTIQTYLLHKKLDTDWQLDLITVKVDMTARQGRVELIENIVI